MFIFPLAAFVFLVFAFSRRFPELSLRENFLLAVIGWSLILVFLTEILSHDQLLSFPYLGGAWIFITMLTIGFCVYSNPPIKTILVKNKISKLKEQLTSLDWVLLTLTGLSLFFVGLTAWMSPPNNWDSLVYHMGRVAHWLQNRTVEHYPTIIQRQLYFPPFAEWVILHFQILSGSDRLANLIQWFAMLGSCLTVSLIARHFGATSRLQIFSAFFCAMIPMGIVQASSTQNDYVTAFWVTVFVYFGLRWQREGRWLDTVAIGGTLGLGFLTKAMISLFAFVFLIWFFVQRIKSNKLKILFQLITILGMIVLINFNHLDRNRQATGHLFGDPVESRDTRNDRMSPTLFISNVLRNMGLHSATSIKPLNRLVEKGMSKIHDLLGVSMTDPATTYGGALLHVEVSTHEDAAGNFCQLTLFFAALILFFLKRREFHRDLKVYLLAVIIAFFLFNLAAKWTPSGSRYHLVFFVLFSPFIAMSFSSMFKQKTVVMVLITLILTSTAVPYVFRNSTRKLYSSKKTVFTTPRLHQYFANEISPMKPYQEAVDFANRQNCHDVGLRIGGNTWEYPFWVMFKQSGQAKVRLEHIDIANTKLKYPLGEFRPCVIIESGRSSPAEEKLNI